MLLHRIDSTHFSTFNYNGKTGIIESRYDSKIYAALMLNNYGQFLLCLIHC